MLKKLISLSLSLTTLLGILGNVSYAQAVPQLEEDIAAVVTEGFEAYCSESSKNPFLIWGKHTIAEFKDFMVSPEMTELMNLLRKGLGDCLQYSVIGSVQVTENTQIVYVESEHKKAPLFWEFTVYHSLQGWIITGFRFNINASQIIPENLLIGG